MTTNEDYETHHEEYLRKQKDIVSDELRGEHANLILDFLYDRDETLEPSTARNYARELRFLIKHTYHNGRLDATPEEWTSQDWNRLIRRVSRERDLKDGSKRNTCYAARALIDWMVETPADKSEIDAPKTEHSKIDKDTVLDTAEVVHIIENARTARDKAVIAVMYEAALRRTALTQLDVRHYQKEPFARVMLPDKIGVKTGQGRERPLLWSQGYLDNWMAEHPNSDDADAPLFCSIRARDDNSRLSSHAIYTMLKRLSDRCDIEDERIHPHALRHARATEMRKSDKFDKADIELVMGWTDSTPMHERYEHATSMEEATRTAKRMGIDVGDDEEQLIEKCPRCNSSLPPNTRYCPTCTLRIDGEPPKWWQIFELVAKETDPLQQQYDALPSVVPELHELPPDELNHLHDVLILADLNMTNDEDKSDLPHPFDGVVKFETQELAEEANEIRKEVQDTLGVMYDDNPHKFELPNSSVDITDAKNYAEQLEAEGRLEEDD